MSFCFLDFRSILNNPNIQIIRRVFYRIGVLDRDTSPVVLFELLR